MAETRRKSNDPKDYKERFEFRFSVGGNVICGRYFKINNFNPACLSSYELAETIQYCGSIIDEDLKDKARAYLELVAPRVFEDEKEMNEYFLNEDNRNGMILGEGIVLRDPDAPNYVWGKSGKPELSPTQFSDGEFSSDLRDDDRVTYELTFLDNGKEVCSTIWEGVYPRYVRKSIDLSNRGPKIEEHGGLYTLGFDGYLRYKTTEGKSDLVFKIIKEICTTCSMPDRKSYTLEGRYGKKLYTNYLTEKELYRKFVSENKYYKDYPKIAFLEPKSKAVKNEKKNKAE